jgi:hypothetical protein
LKARPKKVFRLAALESDSDPNAIVIGGGPDDIKDIPKRIDAPKLKRTQVFSDVDEVFVPRK